MLSAGKRQLQTATATKNELVTAVKSQTHF